MIDSGSGAAAVSIPPSNNTSNAAAMIMAYSTRAGPLFWRLVCLAAPRTRGYRDDERQRDRNQRDGGACVRDRLYDVKPAENLRRIASREGKAKLNADIARDRDEVK